MRDWTLKTRKLQIKLAQLNAKLQADLAVEFGFLAATLVLFVFAQQIGKENFNLSIATWVVAFISIFGTIIFVRRTNTCLDEFEEVK